MASLKTARLVDGTVVEVEFEHLDWRSGGGYRARSGCDDGHHVGVREELLQAPLRNPVATGGRPARYGRVSVVDRAPVMLPDERAHLVPSSRWFGIGHDEARLRRSGSW